MNAIGEILTRFVGLICLIIAFPVMIICIIGILLSD